jgi:hypothetical protein
MRTNLTLTQADTQAEIVDANAPGLSAEAARSLLALRFGKEAAKRIRGLLRKNNRGTITADEQLTLENYLRVGQLLDLLQAKARLSLRHSAGGP